MKPLSLSDRHWLITGGTVLLGALLFAFGRGGLPRKGKSTTYAITVVPADSRGLACASDVSLGLRRCGYDERQNSVAAERPLRPFVTLGRELILLSGVFESARVAAWLESAARNGDESRVTLECFGKVLGDLPSIAVRWAPEGPFQNEQGVTAAEVEDCVVRR